MAADLLADYIGRKIPEFKHIHSVLAEPEEINAYPCAVISASQSSLAFHPEQERSELETGDDSEVVCVGNWTGTFEVRIHETTPAGRDALEARVTELFLEREGAPGTLVLESPPLVVQGVGTLYRAPIAYDIVESEWREELAFSKKRFAFIDVEVVLPALMHRQDRPRIQQLILAVSNDLDAVITDPSVTQYEVSEDGDLTQVP